MGGTPGEGGLLEDNRIVSGRWEWSVLPNTDEMSKMRSESLKAGFGLMTVPDGLDESSFNGVKEEKV